jgi:hypothetical protein
LLALTRLSQEFGADFDRKKIAATAAQMAGSAGTGELTHITACQICAQLGNTNALPVVMQLAENGETIPVRMSAIGALGSLGTSAQIPFLNSVEQGNDDRLKKPAQQALNRLKQRLGS